MENASWDVEAARNGVVPSFLHPLDHVIPMVATADIGRTAAALLQEDWNGVRVVELEGPRRYSAADIGRAFAAALGREVRVEPVPRETWEQLFRSQPPPATLAVVVIGRLAAGFGEAQLVTGCVSWSIASVGPQRAGMSMSRTGIAMFAALAIGAPVGMMLYQDFGLEVAMSACIAAPLIAVVIAIGSTSYASPAGRRLAFYRVVGQIWREGLGLMLQGVGLSGLTAFASLYFAAQAWSQAGLVMTAFGIGFVFVRAVLGSLPDKVGGYRVALWSLIVEAAGQITVWGAPHEIVALAGALVTGLGCALVYPALGVEALKRVLPANRGSAMGAFSAFLDIAYGLAGPTDGPAASAMPPSTYSAPPARFSARR